MLGGGPAGTATALALLERNRSVAVIERSDYKTVRIGETLPPGVRSLLISLGVWKPFLAQNHLPSYGIYSAWGDAGLYSNDFVFTPHGDGWHVDRARFDAMLAAESERSGAVMCRSSRVLSHMLDEGCWKVNILSENRSLEVRAKFVVDATGRSSWLARRQGARPIAHDRLIGAAGFFRPHSQKNGAGNFTLLEAAEDGWWYSAPLPGGRIVATFMTDADIYARESRKSCNYWRIQLERTQATKARLRTRPPAFRPLISPATSFQLDVISGNNWLAVGDAAAAFDPLSSQGVYKALESGLDAAEAIHQKLAGREGACMQYSRRVSKGFDRYLALRTYYYNKEGRWPASVFWKRRNGGIFNLSCVLRD